MRRHVFNMISTGVQCRRKTREVDDERVGSNMDMDVYNGLYHKKMLKSVFCVFGIMSYHDTY